MAAAVEPASRSPSMGMVASLSRAAAPAISAVKISSSAETLSSARCGSDVRSQNASERLARRELYPVGRERVQVFNQVIEPFAVKPRERAVHLDRVTEPPSLVHAHPAKAVKQRRGGRAELRQCARMLPSVL
jgi:hypothetical protein